MTRMTGVVWDEEGDENPELQGSKEDSPIWRESERGSTEGGGLSDEPECCVLLQLPPRKRSHRERLSQVKAPSSAFQLKDEKGTNQGRSSLRVRDSCRADGQDRFVLG